MSGDVIIYVVPYKLTPRDVQLRRRRYEHSPDATQLDVALS